MSPDQPRGHRRSIRLPGYDYTQPGVYFVTICTQDGECLFDDPVLRRIAESMWQQIARHFSQVSVDASVVSLSLLNWRRTRLLRMPRLAALAASLLLPTALLTATVAVRGPGFFWLNFRTNAAGRTLFVTLNVAAIVWMLFLLYAVQRTSLDRSVPEALGNLSVAMGAVFLALGLVPALAGLEKTLTAINDEMAVLPLGLSRILGITTHLGIPPELPVYVMAAGAALLVLGGLLLGLARFVRPKARG